MKDSVNQHFYPIIDLMIDKACEQATQDDETITCKAGCAHCCHLLIEITWEEALDLAHFVLQQPAEKQQQLTDRIQHNAEQARQLFAQHKQAKRFQQPVIGDYSVPDSIFDRYFYDKPLPCPFLVNNRCSAYQTRPSPCRLHLVTSPPEHCSSESAYKDEIPETPEEIEQVREDIGPIISALHSDPRWGHFGVMVEAALLFLKLEGQQIAGLTLQESANTV